MRHEASMLAALAAVVALGLSAGAMLTEAVVLATYTFKTGKIRHHFCPRCGCAPFGVGSDETGAAKAAVNVRCLDGVEPSALRIVPFDGRSL
jgi:hypothetical protein